MSCRLIYLKVQSRIVKFTIVSQSLEGEIDSFLIGDVFTHVHTSIFVKLLQVLCLSSSFVLW